MIRTLAVILIFPIALLAQTTNSSIVYLDSVQQTVRGFGAANILSWRPDMTPGESTKAFETRQFYDDVRCIGIAERNIFL